METARSCSLHCRLVDTGAELKLKPFGSQNSLISVGNPPLPPHAQGPTDESLERERGCGSRGQLLDAAQKRVSLLLLLLLLRKLGAAVTIALHPAPSRRRSLCSYRAQASSESAEAGVPRSSPSCLQTYWVRSCKARDTGTRPGGESRGGPQSRVRGSSSSCYSLTNMAAADAADAACPGRAPSHSRHGTSRQRCRRSSTLSSKQSLLREGGREGSRPRGPAASYLEGKQRPRCARRAEGGGEDGRRCTGRVGRKFAATARPARPEARWE